MENEKIIRAIIEKCDIFYGDSLLSDETIIEKYLTFFARQFNPDTPYDMYGDRSNVVNTDTSYRSSLFGYDTDNNTGNTTDNNTGNNTDTYGTDDSSDTYGSDNQ